jgi:HK97 family phage prohead protease/HK97 family phage major capsid protein
MSKMIHKTIAVRAGDDPLEFVLSDDTKDRYGDIIDPKGWILKNFKNNPIALFNHDSKFPIGTWESVRVEGNKLIGRLKLAAKGTSARIDEIISLLEQGILRAVSVGFDAIDYELLKDNSGFLYKKQELLETSLVSIPANPSAVQLARSLRVSDETINLVFGRSAGEDGLITRRSNGGPASSPPSSRKSTQMTLAQRIEAAQARLVALRDELTEHLKNFDDENADDAALAVTEELNTKITNQERSLKSLKDAEERLAANASQSGPIIDGQRSGNGLSPRPFAVPAVKIKPRELFLRAMVVKVLSHLHKASADEIRVRHYGDDESTKAVVSHFMVQRAASAPATTTTTGWAAELVQTVIADFQETLAPQSVYPALAALGLRLNLGSNGVISIPTRSSTPTIAGSFVAEGAPIPVRQGSFNAQSVGLKKMAVISTFTREIATHSTPAIEGLIRDAIQEDTSVAIDTVLLDATAVSAVRPAGLLNGVAAIAATAGGGFAALVADVKALVGALIATTNGRIRAPVWIMNPIQALSISLTQNAGGDFPFAAEINAGRFQGYPAIVSSTVPAGTLILVDAADFVSIEGDNPIFDVSDQATLHMEDTTPRAIGTVGTPTTVAAPVRSLFQTDSLGLRMILPMNWALRRAGVVAWTEDVTW